MTREIIPDPDPLKELTREVDDPPNWLYLFWEIVIVIVAVAILLWRFL